MTMTTIRDTAVSYRNDFGFQEASLEASALGFADATHPLIPARDDYYVFRRHEFRRVMNFLEEPRSDFMYLHGHFGTGKTSLPNQIAARLNWPVISVDGSREFNPDDLVGRPNLKNANMEFLYGALAKSMMNGYIFIFNEIDSCHPGLLTALHDVAEGRPLTIQTNGSEMVKPHPNWRLIVTGNSRGNGDTTGLYRGVQPLNRAFIDRSRMVEVKYPAPEVELDILSRVTPEHPESIREKFVRVTNEVRMSFIGGGDTDTDDQLTTTISIRGLLRWAELTLDYSAVAKNPVRYALREAITEKADPEEAMAIEEIARSVWGSDWTDEEEEE